MAQNTEQYRLANSEKWLKEEATALALEIPWQRQGQPYLHGRISPPLRRWAEKEVRHDRQFCSVVASRKTN